MGPGSNPTLPDLDQEEASVYTAELTGDEVSGDGNDTYVTPMTCRIDLCAQTGGLGLGVCAILPWRLGGG